MEKMVRVFHRIYPMIIGIAISIGLYYLNIDYKMNNFEKVLENSTVFCSIVIGFLGALLGILVSIKDSQIVKEIFEKEESSTLKAYFNETFIIGIIVVIFSTIMQVVKGQEESTIVLLLFHLWVFLTVWFIPSTYRIVSILMSVFFKANNINANERPTEEVLTEEKNNKIKAELPKPVE